MYMGNKTYSFIVKSVKKKLKQLFWKTLKYFVLQA